jgi:hypothetical protein
MFLERARRTSTRCALVNVTAQCMHPNVLPGVGDNAISVPYLSVYEATNAFGFYHSGSIHKEYGAAFDVLTVTPGAVVTENTPFLRGTIFAVPCDVFVANVLRMLGTVQGATYAHWGHALSAYVIGLVPCAKDRVLRDVGESIARDDADRVQHSRAADAIQWPGCHQKDALRARLGLRLGRPDERHRGSHQPAPWQARQGTCGFLHPNHPRTRLCPGHRLTCLSSGGFPGDRFASASR